MENNRWISDVRGFIWKIANCALACAILCFFSEFIYKKVVIKWFFCLVFLVVAWWMCKNCWEILGLCFVAILDFNGSIFEFGGKILRDALWKCFLFWGYVSWPFWIFNRGDNINVGRRYQKESLPMQSPTFQTKKEFISKTLPTYVVPTHKKLQLRNH